MSYSSVLMFSGGRDSTLASVRLANRGKQLILATVTSEHLEGIASVKARLMELKHYLSEDTLWVLFPDDGVVSPALTVAPNTCLPCFLKYTSLGVIIARKFNIPSLAYGFTQYQSAWPEQTPYAIAGFREVLAAFAINLELPVYDVATKEEVIEKLRVLGLTDFSLEQKCCRQIMNQEIPLPLLEKAINEWSTALYSSVSSNIFHEPTILLSLKLGDINSPFLENEVKRKWKI